MHVAFAVRKLFKINKWQIPSPIPVFEYNRNLDFLSEQGLLCFFIVFTYESHKKYIIQLKETLFLK